MSTPLRERPDAPLGTLIFRAGLLPAETIEAALEEGVKTGKRLGEILTERGLISEVDLARLLAGQKGLEFVTLREQIVDTSAASLFTEEQSRLFRALPYAFDGELPVIAIADPTDEVLIRNIREALGRDDARFVVSARGELAEISADVYSKPLTPAPAPAPTAAPEPEPELPVEPEPELAAHGEHTNGSHPVDAEQILQAPAYEPPVGQQPDFEPEPEPALVSEPVAAPELEAPSFQVPFVEEHSAPEPVVAPEPQPEPEPIAEIEPEPVVAFEPEPAPAPEPPAEPFAVPVQEPPLAYETQAPVEPVPAPEAPVEPAPGPIVAPEPPILAEQPLAPPPPPALEPAVEAELAPVAEPPAALEPVPMPQPDPTPPAPTYPPAASAPEPVPAPEPPIASEPELTPEPESQPEPEHQPEPVAESAAIWRMTIRLTNGEHVEAGDFSDQSAAKEEAKTIMTQIADADAGEWPYVNGRFLKPDTIVSVDIAELSGDET